MASTAADLERYLAAALSAGGDYADLYFEYLTATSLSLDESLVKSASQGISAGCGVRVVAGERTGYAYTDDLAPEKILHAARTAALIASGPARSPAVGPAKEARGSTISIRCRAVGRGRDRGQGRSGACAPTGGPRLRYRASRKCAPAMPTSLTPVLIIGSDGTFAEDRAAALAHERVCHCARRTRTPLAGHRRRRRARTAWSISRPRRSPEHFANEAARQAIIQLDARECPAGEMEVVLGPGWPGILLHEAIGHGLEADFNRKKTSAFSGLLGAARGQREMHGGRQRHPARPARLAQRRRRRQRPPATRAHRKGHSEGLSQRQALGAADGAAEHRQRPARELRAHPHAAHDQHLHAGRRGRSAKTSSAR